MVWDRLESLVEGMTDGVFRWLFRSRVHPVEIARELARALEDRKVISLSRVYAPNEFTVSLHPAELEPMRPFAPELCAELSRFLGDWIAERDYVLHGPVRVTLEAGEKQRPGSIRVECRLVGRSVHDLDEALVPVLELRSDGLYARSSSAGAAIWLNGEPVAERRLADGDRLQVADHVVVFRQAAATGP